MLRPPQGSHRAFGGDHAEVGKQFASTGQPVIVPGDMGRFVDHGWPLKGGNMALARHVVRKGPLTKSGQENADGKALKRSLEAQGVRVHASTPNVLSEEAPDAYKDVDEVIRLTAQTALPGRRPNESTGSHQRMITCRLPSSLAGNGGCCTL